MNRIVRSALVLCAATLAACSGGGHASPPSVPAPGAGAPTVPGSSNSAIPYGQNLLQGATLMGAANVTSVGLDVWTADGNPQGLISYARMASDPSSPLFRHWLTPAEIGAQYGTSQSEYQNEIAYFTSRGIAVQSFPQRQMLRILGPGTNVENALGIHFGVFRKGTQTFIAPESAPQIPSALHVAALGRAVTYQLARRQFVPVRASSSLVTGYAPQQIANAFDYTGAYAAGYTGSGITIGIIGTGPITDGDPRFPAASGDVATFRQVFGVGGSGTVVQDVDLSNVSPGNPAVPGFQYSQGLATPPPVTAANSTGCTAQGYPTNPITDYTTCNPEDVEAQLDTEQTSALAPNATINFYIAYNPTECFVSGGPYPAGKPCLHAGVNGVPATPQQALGISLSDDEIQQAIADDKSDVLSLSFGGAEPASTPGYFDASGNGFGPAEFAALVAEGTAVFVSSGDNGAQGCGTSAECVIYPASDPSVVAVGGVNSPLNAAGQLVGPLTGWGAQTQAAQPSPSGSGGGCSQFFALTAFQAATTGIPCSKRALPDVSLDADTLTGVSVISNSAPGLGGPNLNAVGGTSVAAPEAAAMWALVLQACKASSTCTASGHGANPYRLGNPNAYYYPIYRNAQTYASTFYDVQFGSNNLPGDAGFTSGVGYDLVTGIGVPYALHLVQNVLPLAAGGSH
ncbi:MAG: S53 family peptidase [Vulcanimicrobiaceae bacterium]